MDQVVVLIGCETGETQVFTDNPVNWVRSLRREIEEYNNAFPQEDSSETSASLF